MWHNESTLSIRMARVGLLTDEERQKYEEQKISIKKSTSKILSDARNNAKRGTCLICGKPCTSFCNSHSIPKFALKRISKSGNVSATLQGEIISFDKETGIGKAGTFHLICTDCDNRRFQEYENPLAYNQPPTEKMLAQIAMKNYLQMISKRNEEKELYRILGEQYPDQKVITDERQAIGEHDLSGYNWGYKYAKKATETMVGKYFHLCFFQILDYVVPFAAQSAIAMISDFEDNVINDVFLMDPNYQLKEIHISVFPLESSSVVMMFVKDGETRYRNFYKQLRKLTLDEQLAAINYIIFSYTENVYLNATIAQELRSNEAFMDTCRKTVDVVSSVQYLLADPLPIAIEEFSLSKRNTIPNLLSREYGIV